jgi:predicted Fe-S protein YdhL (DUF1289 family)
MAVKSPCVDVCKFEGKTGLCIACLRTREEARGWKKMSDHRRHQIINERPMRETRLARQAALADQPKR